MTVPCFLIYLSSIPSEVAPGPQVLCQTQTESTCPENCLSRDFMPQSFTLQHKSYNKSKRNFVYKWTSSLPEFITSYLIISSLPLIYVALVIHKGFRLLFQNASGSAADMPAFPEQKPEQPSLLKPCHADKKSIAFY